MVKLAGTYNSRKQQPPQEEIYLLKPMESRIEEEVPSFTKQKYRPCQRCSTKKERMRMEYPDFSLHPPSDLLPVLPRGPGNALHRNQALGTKQNRGEYLNSFFFFLTGKSEIWGEFFPKLVQLISGMAEIGDQLILIMEHSGIALQVFSHSCLRPFVFSYLLYRIHRDHSHPITCMHHAGWGFSEPFPVLPLISSSRDP